MGKVLENRTDVAWMEEAPESKDRLRKAFNQKYSEYESYMRKAAKQAGGALLQDPEDVFQILSFKLWKLTENHHDLPDVDFRAYLVQSFENAIIDLYFFSSSGKSVRNETTILQGQFGGYDGGNSLMTI